MPTYGITSAGFVAKPQSVLLGEIEADQLSLIRADLDLSPVQPLGQNNGIISSKLAEIWEILPVLFNATNRGHAEGAALDNVNGLTGTTREPPTPSTVYTACSFSLPGTYAVGALVAQIDTISSQQASNAVAVVVPVTNPADGTPVGVGHPYVATGVLFQAPTPGPNFANALLSVGLGHLTTKVPVSGWVSVVDTSEPVVGALLEQDTPYRVRGYQDLGASSSSTLPGVKAAIELALQSAPSPVTGASVQVYENTSQTTNANGIPGKSYMAVVFDGLTPNTAQNDPLIAQAIWNSKPTCGSPFGSITRTVLDSGGVQRVVGFSRAAQVPVYLVVNVSILANASASQVQSLVSAAIIAASQGQPFTFYGQTVTPPAGAQSTLLPGIDVVGAAFKAIAQGQAGVAECTGVLLGLSASPTLPNTIRIDATSIGVISGVVVNCVSFVP